MSYYVYPNRAMDAKTLASFSKAVSEASPETLELFIEIMDHSDKGIFINGVATEKGEEKKGRRFIAWTFIKNLEKDGTREIMEKIKKNVRISFFIRHGFCYLLENIENGDVIQFYKNLGSPWIKKLSEAEEWVKKQETMRLESDNIERPSTKWKFLRFFRTTVKVVIDKQPLLGEGRLPNWLRDLARGFNGPMVCLDTYEDDLCIWRCIAVYKGARPDRSTRSAKQMANGFFESKKLSKTSLDDLNLVENYVNKNELLSGNFGIKVYQPEQKESGDIVWSLVKNSPENTTNEMTIGIYEGHAFLIKKH